ncbi:hypothetical protein CEXT_170841 [Caerostris extrusa]|uniref:Uncharacterized protein n=1 Tax=Caerostris extrusa TaxID=172846 RepID=A0AAV4XU88_CAEEX|nr:hypothetical protein CEXT_170841 [Caerostris extrusa]
MHQGTPLTITDYSKYSFLPRGFLRGVNASQLLVNDTDFQGFDEKAFEGVIELRYFLCSRAPHRIFQTSGLSGTR